MTTVDVPTPDGVADATFVTPADGEQHPGVLLFMDAFGLRPRITEMAERIAAEGYVVLAPNLYHRSGRSPLFTGLDALKDPSRRDEVFAQLGAVRKALTPQLLVADTTSYLTYLQEHSTGPIGTTGYCMGGALALLAAADHPDTVAAAASFHGGRLATDAPDSPHLRAPDLRAEVYLGHADHDSSMPPEQIARLEQALSDAGVTFTSELYAGAQHGFTMSDTAAYDEAAEQRHWDALLELFARRLNG